MLNTKPFYTQLPSKPSWAKTGEQMYEEQEKDAVKSKILAAIKSKKLYRLPSGPLITDEVNKKSHSNPILTSQSITDYAIGFVKYSKGYRDIIVSIIIDTEKNIYRLVIKDFESGSVIDDQYSAWLGNVTTAENIDLHIKSIVVNKEGARTLVITTESFIEALKRKVGDLIWQQ